MIIVAGIDPGLDGALAFLDAHSLRIVAMIGMPALKLGKGKGAKREISARTLFVEVEREILSPGIAVHRAWIERVQSSPQMGRVSAFQFGRGYGMLEMLVAALGWPAEYVTPQKWMRAFRLGTEKDDARALACQLLPRDAHHWTPRRLVMTQAQAEGRADAALLALFGARLIGSDLLAARAAE